MDVDSESSRPTSNLQTVLDGEVKEWLFHIYFNQKNADQMHMALELRDSILSLRRDGAFVAVPLFRVNTEPTGPHPIGSYELWVPGETMSSALSYICQNRRELSVMIHPLTKEPHKDIASRAIWLGATIPLDLSAVDISPLPRPPSRYPSLKLGYSATAPALSIDDRRRLGQNVESILKGERIAARAPLDL